MTTDTRQTRKGRTPPDEPTALPVPTTGGNGFPQPAKPAIEHPPLTHEDYMRLKGHMPTFRDLLLLQCLRATGLRIAELLACTPAHVQDDGVHLALLVKRGKRRLKAGTQTLYEPVPLPPELGIALRDYIKGHRIGPADTLFGIGARQVRNVLAKAGRAAIGRPVHPHEMRGLYITWLIDHGLPLEAVSKMVGHQDTRTTHKWYYKLTADKRHAIQAQVPV